MTRHAVAPEATPGFFLSVLKPIFIALSVTFLSLCFLAVCIAYGPVTEQAADICILLSTIVSIFIAGFLTARQRNARGFVLGSLAGVLYVAAAYVIAALAFGSFSPGSGFLKLLLLGIVFGALGGIISVNTRRKKR